MQTYLMLTDLQDTGETNSLLRRAIVDGRVRRYALKPTRRSPAS
jgi:hypothetical protein